MFLGYDGDLIYLIIHKGDSDYYTFHNPVKGFPKSNELTSIIIERQDEDGNDCDEELQLYKIPLNCYNLIEFEEEYSRLHFQKIMKRYYLKERS